MFVGKTPENIGIAMGHPGTEALSVLRFYVVKHQKICVLQSEIRMRKLPKIVSCFRICILVGITQKNMHFVKENPNTETASNFRQLRYLDFSF